VREFFFVLSGIACGLIAFGCGLFAWTAWKIHREPRRTRCAFYLEDL
jgi:hypothetical protein